jgi:outer membrane protein TolC
MERRMLCLAVAAATAFAGRARPAAAQEVRTVTLAEALQLAGRDQPGVVQARQNVRIAQAGERVAFGAFLPTITASAGSTTSGSGTTRIDQASGRVLSSGTSYADNAGINASISLFTGFQRGANRRAAQATTELRDANLLQQQYAIALAAKQAYFAALEAAELVGVAQTQLRLTEEQVKLTSERLRLGATTRSDSLRAMVTHANAQLALINAQNSLQNAQVNLARTIQVPGRVMAVPDTGLEARLGTLDTAQLHRDAVATAPSIRQAEASVRNARAALSAQRAVWMPTLSASASNRWSRNDSLFFGGGGAAFTRAWSVGLSLNYSLFNGFQRESNIITADANATSAEATLRDARLALEASLIQQVSALNSAAASIDVSRVSVAAAEEDLRMQRERYRLGAVTIIEVLTSQTSLEQAQVNLVTTRYNYLVARAQIEALVGRGL